MATLGELAKYIRSKNAGPFVCTFDIMFEDAETYQRVVDSGAITADRIGRLYNLSADKVQLFNFKPALAIKLSIPRLVPAGDPADRDVCAGQTFTPLVDLQV